MKIGIRVDVNQEIATGHIKRDIAVALCLREMGYESVFISADENCEAYLKPYEFENVILHSMWDDMEGELTKIGAVIEAYRIESLLVDSYMVTEKYMKELANNMAELFTNKYLMREKCREIGIDTIKYKVVTTCEEAVVFYKNLCSEGVTDAIMKPVDSAGSRGNFS